MSSKAYLRPSDYASHPNTMGDRTPYCYLIGWSTLGKWYYGRRTAKGCHPSEFLKRYFTSSDVVKQYIQEHGLPDIAQIRYVGETIDGVAFHETTALRRMNAAKNPKFLNRTNGDANFDNTGIVTVIEIESGNKVTIPVDEFDRTKYISHAKGRVNVIEIETGNQVTIPVDEFDRTKYVSYMKGRVNVRDINTGEYVHISVDEFDRTKHVSYMKGRVTVKDLETGESECISVDEFDRMKYVHNSFGKVNVRDVNTNETYKITQEEFQNSPEHIVSITKNRVFIESLETGEISTVPTGTEIDRTKFKYRTGKPLNTKETIEQRKLKQEAGTKKLTVRDIETGKCSRHDREDALRLLEEGTHVPVGKGIVKRDETRKSLSKSIKENAMTNRVCDIVTRQEYSTAKFLARDKMIANRKESVRINRVCRLQDRKEMETRSFIAAEKAMNK